LNKPESLIPVYGLFVDRIDNHSGRAYLLTQLVASSEGLNEKNRPEASPFDLFVDRQPSQQDRWGDRIGYRLRK
jgi:hypothetical protein